MTCKHENKIFPTRNDERPIYRNNMLVALTRHRMVETICADCGLLINSVEVKPPQPHNTEPDSK